MEPTRTCPPAELSFQSGAVITYQADVVSLLRLQVDLENMSAVYLL
jgi:hypothetical protein